MKMVSIIVDILAIRIARLLVKHNETFEIFIVKERFHFLVQLRKHVLYACPLCHEMFITLRFVHLGGFVKDIKRLCGFSSSIFDPTSTWSKQTCMTEWGSFMIHGHKPIALISRTSCLVEIGNGRLQCLKVINF